MSNRPNKKRNARKPANDNKRRSNPLRAEMHLPLGMPIQMVEVEVFAQLLDSLPLAANDNEEPLQ